MNEVEFILIAEIDFCYWALKEISGQLGTSPKSPIEDLIDKSTGFYKEKTDQIQKNGEELIKRIIKNKTKLNIDSKRDKEFLKKILEIK